MARSLEISTVVGVNNDLLTEIEQEVTVIMDGLNGKAISSEARYYLLDVVDY